MAQWLREPTALMEDMGPVLSNPVGAHSCVTLVQEIRCPLLATKGTKRTRRIDLVHENKHSFIRITMKMNKALITSIEN